MPTCLEFHDLKCLHSTLLSLSNPANTRDRVAEMLVVRQEVDVHSPTRMWATPVSTGTGVLEGTLLRSMHLTSRAYNSVAWMCQ
jgi:hypothetical protein